jgi:tetratricopeptide (TPR) repeat protein
MKLSRICGSLSLIGLMISLNGGTCLSQSEGVPKSTDAKSLGSSPASGEKQEEQKPKKITERVKEWSTAVVQHEAGKADPAAVSIGSLHGKDLQTVISYVTKLASQPPKTLKRTLAKTSIRRMLELTEQEAQQGDLNRILKRGALLCTDIALLHLETGVYPYTYDGMGAFADGRMEFQPTTPQWDFARQQIDSVSSPSKDPMVRQWYIATIAYLQSRGFLGYAGQILKYALEKLPNDPHILFYAGALHENWALPFHQNVVMIKGAKVTYGLKEAELKLALQYFQKVVALDPGFAEAHLRLGRVLSLLDQRSKAVAELQQAAASIKDPQLLYYTSLYLGYEFEMLARRNEAREQYERAAMLYPAAQSPLLALSQLAHSGDDVKGALLALQRVFDLPRRDFWKDDPLWIYYLAHVRDADVLVAEMHRMLGGLSR